MKVRRADIGRDAIFSDVKKSGLIDLMRAIYLPPFLLPTISGRGARTIWYVRSNPSFCFVIALAGEYR
jgi:hypothetical protein